MSHILGPVEGLLTDQKSRLIHTKSLVLVLPDPPKCQLGYSFMVGHTRASYLRRSIKWIVAFPPYVLYHTPLDHWPPASNKRTTSLSSRNRSTWNHGYNYQITSKWHKFFFNIGLYGFLTLICLWFILQHSELNGSMTSYRRLAVKIVPIMWHFNLDLKKL